MTHVADLAELVDSADLVVLDADGVVFSPELDGFLRTRATVLGLDPDGVLERWRNEVSVPFFAGALTPSEMWAAVFPGENPALLTAELERRYRPGPMFDVVARGNRRVWILANDRSGWLFPRLRRFGLAGGVERVIVSDEGGLVTPDAAAFAPVIDAMRFDRVVLVDDDPAIVCAAAQLGIEASAPSGDRPLGDHPLAA